MARRLGSAIMAKADSTTGIYLSRYIPVKSCPPDAAAIAEGYHTIWSDTVHVTDPQGRALGSQPLNGEDPELVARKVSREKRSGGFYAPIRYPMH